MPQPFGSNKSNKEGPRTSHATECGHKQRQAEFGARLGPKGDLLCGGEEEQAKDSAHHTSPMVC